MLGHLLLAFCLGGWLVLLALRDTGYLSVRRGAGAAYARRLAAKRDTSVGVESSPVGAGVADDLSVVAAPG
jgi:hypothetical protein